MRKETRFAFAALAVQIALLNGVASAHEKFSVDPSIQQKLEVAVQESDGFLKQINIIGVDEQSGEALLLGVNGPVASRTDTSGGTPRSPLGRSTLSKDSYVCKQTNFDSAFPYALLDAWAKFPDFQVKLSNAIILRQALDRIMIGFNGTSAAATTKRAANPLLQDVNIGWLQKIRLSLMTGCSTLPPSVLAKSSKWRGSTPFSRVITPTSTAWCSTLSRCSIHGTALDQICASWFPAT